MKGEERIKKIITEIDQINTKRKTEYWNWEVPSNLATSNVGYLYHNINRMSLRTKQVRQANQNLQLIPSIWQL